MLCMIRLRRVQPGVGELHAAAQPRAPRHCKGLSTQIRAAGRTASTMAPASWRRVSPVEADTPRRNGGHRPDAFYRQRVLRPHGDLKSSAPCAGRGHPP